MAGGLKPTVPPSKEHPASALTAFTSFRREKRELGIGPPEQGRMDTGLVLRGQYIAARPRHYPGVKAMGAKENSLLLLFEHLLNLADFLLDFAVGLQVSVVRDLSHFLFNLAFQFMNLAFDLIVRARFHLFTPHNKLSMWKSSVQIKAETRSLWIGLASAPNP